ncbi:hypothetical protein GSI_04385 [Ganoderma sinense ZZ0214-1]|uniref:Uncharacterized protein n=1 Tax=Ganoderma sinense ZZ0214-1 TaxID=1077348 RepID=A0A2G8SJ42_9APHY|nr:hypothetical protein GSI_04385 [Ganoderma sinense ZZ0214-1]
MAKTTRTSLARTSRLAAFGRHAVAPLRPRDLTMRRARAAREPRSPAEFFIRSLFAEQTADVPLSNSELKMEAEIVLKVYVDVTLGAHEGFFADPSTFTLVVRVESALPTGGTHTARVDTWSGISEDDLDAPLWVSEVRATQPRPLRFPRTLDWLSLYVDAIAARPSGSPGDVWGRLAEFSKSLQGAYRRYPIPNSSETPRPIPRPRPLRFTQDYFALIRQLEAWQLKDDSEVTLD